MTFVLKGDGLARANDWNAERAAAKQLVNDRGDDSTTHYTLYYGPSLPCHGTSRAHQNRLIDSGGCEWFTNETPDVEIGTRVKFKSAIDPTTTERVAVEVTPAAPAVTVAASKIAPRNKAK